ncbi:Peptidase family M20/M25/M40 protein [Coniochaeta hoffmannii]|uniref:Peptidase family M20/M25/M40 protein n=1 Tax=Coniochaeta hoffmannii TaxID=91930 RepID=A0AA38RWX5_9PEZI|nr:Peptidase family M20/M25/M40 protein [Coniochaeta hoffmannii]
MVDTTDPAFGLMEIQHPHYAHTRRQRPADLDISSSDERRIPLRPEKLNRRESRLGLRNLFGRQKSNSDEDVSSARDVAGRAGGIRASVAHIGNWPYGLHGHKSEITLPFLGQASQSRPKTPPGGDHLKHRKSTSAVKPLPSPKSTQRAAWDPPPLFQAYPQAIRHVQLPASTMSAEAIIRMYGPRAGSSLGFAANGGDDAAGEKTKKRHRRNTSASSFKSDWTTKIYVLVTSGYLLQYAGEGSFDRLPEKMLHLGKDSAAFASDVIPGRHWVLQVTSVMDLDGATGPHSASIFSRLPFRGVVEKKQTSNFLMVFESAEDMEGWIVVLRREIEALGGKKSLSETGKPKVDDRILHLKAQPSQRTLVVRDPDRFSKVLPQGISWDHPDAMANPGIRLSVAESDITRDQSFDDTSTASGVSQDGRQLDGLRDSTHRLSYMSSGQRTVVTSAGSSPACSPTRDSFGSQLTDSPGQDSLHEGQSWPRPRPNASAILDRRQSMQAVNHLAEMRIASAAPRPLSTTTYSSSWQSTTSVSFGAPVASTIPNFSVPHSVGKRFSMSMQPPSDPALSSSLSMQQNLGIVRPGRRPPPTALSINPRPLSLVMDQPSPEPTSPDALSKQLATAEEMTGPDTPSTFSPWGVEEDQGQGLPTLDRAATMFQTPHMDDGDHAIEKNSPSLRARKHPSTSTIRVSDVLSETEVHSGTTVQPIHISQSSERPTSGSSFRAKHPRSKSSMDTYGRSKSPVPSPGPWNGHFKRFSLRPASPDTTDHYTPDDSEITLTITSITSQDSSIRSHTPTLFKTASSKPTPKASSSVPGKNPDVGSKGLFARRSMSRLTDIPPPAPPPTCALPALPPVRKAS